MIDDVYKPWLIEVNLSPSLSCDTPLDQKIKGNLMADVFTLSGIVPLEKRSKVEVRKQGLHYGVYSEKQDKPLSKSRQRRSNAASAKQSPFNLDFNSTVHKIMNKGKLTKDEKDVLRETDEEYKLKGHFKRVFPNGNYCLYKSFFVEEKPYNILLDNK
jgi:tubulin polyglutamylase TTLL5